MLWVNTLLFRSRFSPGLPQRADGISWILQVRIGLGLGPSIGWAGLGLVGLSREITTSSWVGLGRVRIFSWIGYTFD